MEDNFQNKWKTTSQKNGRRLLKKGRRPEQKWKRTSNFFEMEGDLKERKNGRRPKKINEMRTN